MRQAAYVNVARYELHRQSLDNVWVTFAGIGSALVAGPLYVILGNIWEELGDDVPKWEPEPIEGLGVVYPLGIEVWIKKRAMKDGVARTVYTVKKKVEENND